MNTAAYILITALVVIATAYGTVHFWPPSDPPETE